MTTLTAKPESPYLAASAALRSEYERLAHSHRMMRQSMIAMAIALVLSSTLSLYLARKPHVVPYVVEMDKAGEIIGVAQPLAANQSVSDAVIRFELARFITDARSVLSDGAAEKAALHRVYDMARGEAATVLPTWYRQPSAIRDRKQGDDSVRGGFGLARSQRCLRGALDGSYPEPQR